MRFFATVTTILILLITNMTAYGKTRTLLNVSYDPTRDLYQQINTLFIKEWAAKTGEVIEIRQSHGGSGKQALSVMQGLEADVVSLALGYDIDSLADKGLLPKDWQSRLPMRSAPYYSTIVFLVRVDNPKHIHDWDDLIRPDVSVITANPKTSGGARWNYLAAYGYALDHYHNDPNQAKAFIKRLYQQVTVLDSGSRASSLSFTQRDLGDVLITWENEAMLAIEKRPGQFQIIIPSRSIKTEPPVAWIDQNTQKHHTGDLAKAYLEYLYSEDAQNIMIKSFYRANNPPISSQPSPIFPKINLFTLEKIGENWQQIQRLHFSNGGIFDQIMTAKE